MRMQSGETHVRNDADARIACGKLVARPAAVGSIDGHVVNASERAAYVGFASRENVAVITLFLQHDTHDGTQRLLARISSDRGAECGIDDGIFFDSRDVFEREHVVEKRAQAGLDARRFQ